MKINTAQKNTFKILLDAVMAVLMVMMFNKRIIGMKFHEVGGLFVLLFVAVHVIINYKWVIAITKKFFGKQLKFKTRLGYLINFLLLICMVLIGISGILISKTIFTGISSSNGIWKVIHMSTPSYAVILVGIHVGLHWPFIKGMAKKVLQVPIKLQKPLTFIGLAVIIALGSYNAAYSRFSRYLSMPFAVASGNAADSHGNGQDFKGQGPKGEGLKGSNHPEGFDRNAPNQGGHMENGKGGRQGGFPEASKDIDPIAILQLIISYLSIIALFATATVWIEKWITSSKKPKLQQ